MEILLWLVPPVVVTVLAMLWVAWLGRADREAPDREAAVRRLGAVLDKPAPRGYAVTRPAGLPREAGSGDRSSGVAVRPSRRNAS